MIVYLQPHTRAISSTVVSENTPTTLLVADNSMRSATTFCYARPQAWNHKRSGVRCGASRRFEYVWRVQERQESSTPRCGLRSSQTIQPQGSQSRCPCGQSRVIMVTDLGPHSCNHGHWSSGEKTQIAQEEARRFEEVLVQRARRTEHGRLHSGRLPAGGVPHLRRSHRPEVYHLVI